MTYILRIFVRKKIIVVQKQHETNDMFICSGRFVLTVVCGSSNSWRRWLPDITKCGGQHLCWCSTASLHTCRAQWCMEEQQINLALLLRHVFQSTSFLFKFPYLPLYSTFYLGTYLIKEHISYLFIVYNLGFLWIFPDGNKIDRKKSKT